MPSLQTAMYHHHHTQSVDSIIHSHCCLSVSLTSDQDQRKISCHYHWSCSHFRGCEIIPSSIFYLTRCPSSFLSSRLRQSSQEHLPIKQSIFKFNRIFSSSWDSNINININQVQPSQINWYNSNHIQSDQLTWINNQQLLSICQTQLCQASFNYKMSTGKSFTSSFSF